MITFTILQTSSSWIDNFWLPLLLAIVLAIGGYFISKLRNKIKISINYNNSYWTTSDGEHYVVINLTIINNDNKDLNTLTFSSKPLYTLTDNIWSLPSITQDGGSTMIMGAMTQIQDSFKDTPVNVKAHDRISGNLIFESPTPNCSLMKLIATYQDKNISIDVKSDQIEYRNID